MDNQEYYNNFNTSRSLFIFFFLMKRKYFKILNKKSVDKIRIIKDCKTNFKRNHANYDILYIFPWTNFLYKLYNYWIKLIEIKKIIIIYNNIQAIWFWNGICYKIYYSQVINSYI